MTDIADKLAKALEPFVDYAQMVAKDHPGWNHDWFTLGLPDSDMTMAPFRNARAALSEYKAAKSAWAQATPPEPSEAAIRSGLALGYMAAQAGHPSAVAFMDAKHFGEALKAGYAIDFPAALSAAQADMRAKAAEEIDRQIAFERTIDAPRDQLQLVISGMKQLRRAIEGLPLTGEDALADIRREARKAALEEALMLVRGSLLSRHLDGSAHAYGVAQGLAAQHNNCIDVLSSAIRELGEEGKAQ
jgi:hypothetical protein